ncbi:MAG: prepilin-type N-terminal cleavage/methylation domain-containing protein, partial [bacterium]
MSNTGHTINKGTGRTIRKARAFTLVEILVVIALTGLLLALVLGPLVQGFRLTNRARAYSAAQEAMRYGIEQLRAELSQAAYVYDNTNAPIVLPLGPDANNDGKPDANDARDPIMYP